MSQSGLEPAGVVFVVAAGEGSGDHRRCVAIASSLPGRHEFVFRDRRANTISEVSRIAKLLAQAEGLIFVEGTGIATGLAAMLAARRRSSGARYVVSSGDAVSTFLRNRYGRVVGGLGKLYERALYKRSWAFVGWTPYLVGRAIEMGAPRGLTVEGFAPAGFDANGPDMRKTLGIAPTDLVLGVSGSLNWSKRQQYCYGLELVKASAHTKRADVRFLVVGDGSGLDRLRELAGTDPRFVFTGRVPFEDMPAYLRTMDLAVISQTPDVLGLCRLTTKMPEYLACGIPVAMTASPGFHDYVGRAGMALPLLHPASDAFAKELASVFEKLDPADLAHRARIASETAAARFDRSELSARFASLVETTPASDTAASR
ncbi:glycosyltransferase [Demequina sp. NBRC 110051]|uniref:glycosyltransferase n=1 Tax=Demequina sp. NBRC 110051 TaxID=1570340 RepID=UPI0013565A60|nr:glycosyltransferase [Demequina sp. NBRC 110051]